MAKTQEQKLISPCLHVCSLIEGQQICGGCYRTTEEIKAWRKLDKAARRVILQNSEKRQRNCEKDRGEQ